MRPRSGYAANTECENCHGSTRHLWAGYAHCVCGDRVWSPGPEDSPLPPPVFMNSRKL